MGTSQSKIDYRKAVVRLSLNSEPIPMKNDAFWQNFWPNEPISIQDYYSLMSVKEIRKIRDFGSSNLATLCYKSITRIVQAVDSNCVTYEEQQSVLNCIRLLTLVMPYIFESNDWNEFFWSVLPDSTSECKKIMPLAHSLFNSLFNLLFCPDFTVGGIRKNGPDGMENLTEIDSCEYIWEPGIGCAYRLPKVTQFEENRNEILKLILTCCSESMYSELALSNRWISFLTSDKNRHSLPLFTSLLNTIFSFDPIGYGVPYNYLLSNDSSDKLAEVVLQLLIISLDYDTITLQSKKSSESSFDNLFIDYLSRIYLESDFEFVLKGLSNLLKSQLVHSYLPNSVKRIHFHQELLIFFWKFCDYNKKFMNYVLKSSLMLDILVPILYHLNDSSKDPSKLGLIHMGLFILLMLSGERNFGVRLNKLYTASIHIDIPTFNGTHADLLILVFHKIITTNHQKLQPLYDCLLTILVNVSPYLKSLTMLSCIKLLNLLEIFSTPWYMFSNSKNYHLVVFLLEIFNNLIQYQFDGNANLIYTIIRKRQVFQDLNNLSLVKNNSSNYEKLFNDNQENLELNSNYMKTSLAKTPNLNEMTEQEESNISLENELRDLTICKDKGIYKKSISESTDSDGSNTSWTPTIDWVKTIKSKLPLQIILRMLHVLIPQIEKICTKSNEIVTIGESEILRFLQQGTLVGLLPVPHPILIRKYQSNSGTTKWFRTYTWGVIYLRNIEPPIWYDTDVKLFEIQKI